ncbi:MAG: hypothetical protein JO202_01900 [Ktedonobacteraceae bacterium]|nr:hypothetical protein [Ktedonobacteraceae bacterium]
METLTTTELAELVSILVERQKKKIKLIVSDIEGCLNLDLSATFPAVFENGCGLYFPTRIH